MKRRARKALADFMLILLLICITTVSPVLAVIFAVLAYTATIVHEPRKRADTTHETVVNNWVYVDGNARKRVN